MELSEEKLEKLFPNKMGIVMKLMRLKRTVCSFTHMHRDIDYN